MPRETRRPGQATRPGILVSPQKQSLQSPVKIPLNDDREEKAVRFQSRHALQEMQMNSIKAAASPMRKRQSIGPTDSPRTPNSEDKENAGSHGLTIVNGNAITPMKRVPILANFEEWMKMATDNKINATNSWNFALIDYFYDMSLLREGDSVNFQKASCTLDGCVKIYTSRVDSVATETGKLLSGLADSGNKKRKGDDGGDGDAEEDEEEEGENGVKKRAKKRVQRSSEATLASSFAQLQVKKMELEFSVDPLFKKASADFDEGGAKGLLLNHLTIDAQGKIVFDSSEDAKDERQEGADETENSRIAAVERTVLHDQDSSSADERKSSPPKETPAGPIDMESLGQRFFPDIDKLDEQDICPSLTTFELGGNADSLDIPFLKAQDDWKKDQSPSKGQNDNGIEPQDGGAMFDDDDDAGVIGFEAAGDVGFGEGGEAWARDAAIATQPKPFDMGLDKGLSGSDETGEHIGSYNADSAQYGVTLAQDHDHENILSYFDQALQKNWAGPEHWRIRKIKDTTNKPAAPTRQRKEKESFEIDFAAPMTQAMADALYTPATSNSSICLPRTQWKSKTRNLLPDDKHFNSRQLLRLFLKPKARIGSRKTGGSSGGGHSSSSGGDNVPEGEMDEAFWARRHQDAAESMAAEEQARAQGDYDANFFQDDALGAPVGMDDDEEFADAREGFSPAVEGDPAQPMDPNGGILAPDSQQDGFGSQLVTQSRRLRPEYVQYARVAKKVDVRRLKEEMWRGIDVEENANQDQTPSEKTPAPSLSRQGDGSLRFTSVINSLQSVYPKQAMEDISTSYCFICLLHLANERGLVLNNESNFEEISIRRDYEANIEEEAAL
ncbi:MAG: hypothetical protein M1831_004796 [Alyxoria varia]|nr:MAG: hypothetical protein M1831_004796 [Alyxoria varia]